MVVGRRGTEQSLERRGWRRGMARAPVDEMRSSGERLSPEGIGHVGVNEQTAHVVVERAYDLLSFPVLS